MTFESGFIQFWVYRYLRSVYYRSNKKYGLRLANREACIKEWNEKIVQKSGYYQKLDKTIPQSKMAYMRLFSYYYLNDNDFYVSDIFEDNFEIWEKYEFEIRNLKLVLENDLNKVVKQAKIHDIGIDRFFKKGKMPLVFRMYDKKMISLHSLLIFDQVFGIHECVQKNDSFNIIEREKIKNYSIIFERYYPIVENFFNKVDWSEHLKKMIVEKMIK